MKTGLMKKPATSSKGYISRDPQVMGGAPVISGTRIPISRILYLLKDGYTIGSISEDYPHVGKKKIEKAVEQAIRDIDDPNAQTFL